MRLLRLICVPFFVLISSCQGSTEPTTGLDAIQVSLRIDPTTVTAGDTVSITLMLTNRSAAPVTISSCPVYYWVETHRVTLRQLRPEDDGPIVAGSRNMFCVAGSLVYAPLTFLPRETKTHTLGWLVGPPELVPPGIYDVFGWVNEPARRSIPTQVRVL